MATPHINAERGDFADVVLMPGDPLRAKYIAENFLEDIKQVNNVRGMLGFTGTYKGRRISVMGHGMGIPSCSIYAKELITEFDVKTIIRVGSCGAISRDVKLRDVVIGMGASTDSKVNRLRFKDNDFAAIADFGLVRNAVEAAETAGIPAVSAASTALRTSPKSAIAAKSLSLKRRRFTLESVLAPMPITTSRSLTSRLIAPQEPTRIMVFTSNSVISSLA